MSWGKLAGKRMIWIDLGLALLVLTLILASKKKGG